MKNPEPVTNNLFLIGAGFTKAVFQDAPLNKDLFYEIVRVTPKTRLNLYSKRYGTEDIEILLTRLDIEIAETKSDVLAQDRKHIENNLVEYFSKFRFVPNKDKLKEKPWLKKLSCEVLCENDAIVTTNYDCFLEGVLDFYEVWSPNGGYVGVSGAAFSSPENPKNISIFKIHGSEHFRLFGRDKHKEYISFDMLENDGIFLRAARNSNWEMLDIKLCPYIIAPSFVKFPPVQIANMVNKAIIYARSAQNMVIGGSALRCEDSSLWLLVTSFLWWRDVKVKKKLKLIIVDPDADRIMKEIEQYYWNESADYFAIVPIKDEFNDKSINKIYKLLVV
jgi:hypothetical protein